MHRHVLPLCPLSSRPWNRKAARADPPIPQGSLSGSAAAGSSFVGHGSKPTFPFSPRIRADYIHVSLSCRLQGARSDSHLCDSSSPSGNKQLHALALVTIEETSHGCRPHVVGITARVQPVAIGTDGRKQCGSKLVRYPVSSSSQRKEERPLQRLALQRPLVAGGGFEPPTFGF